MNRVSAVIEERRAGSRRSSTRAEAWGEGAPEWRAMDVVDPFDRAIEWGLYALLAFMPLALGAVQGWSELVVMIAVAGMAMLLAVKLVVRPGADFVWSWTYVPVGLFVGLAALQLMEFPQSVVAAVSPGTVRLKGELLGDLGGAAGGMTLSFYPHATARDLRLVLAAAAIFAVVVNVFRRSKQIVQLLIAVAAIGGAVAGLALLQNLMGAREIYWSIYNGEKPANSGTFVNQNNFAQFLNLSIGAGLAVLLVRLREVMGAGGRVLSRVRVYAGDAELRLAWAMGAVVVLCAVGVILSMSRMGVVSLLVAGVVTGVVMATRKEGGGAKAWVLAPIGLVVFAGVLWVGFDAVYERLSTLRKLGQADSGSRWQTLVDLRPVFKEFGVLGVGLGAHETFYPMYDSHVDALVTAHVENEYAQVLEEMGGAGLGLVLLFAGMVWWSWWRGMRAARVPVSPAAIGLGFGLLAVMIHSTADFGQHLPAVAGLSAVTCGVLVVLGQKGRAVGLGSSEVETRANKFAHATRIVGAVATAAVLGWAVLGAASAARAESYGKEVDRAERHLDKYGWEGAAGEDLERLLRLAGDAARAEPGDVRRAHDRAALRWRVMSTDPNRRDRESGDLLLAAEDLEEVKGIVESLHAGRRLCPTFGANLAMAGQLERFVLDRNEAGAAHIRMGYRLSRNDPHACFVAGYLDVVEGRAPESVEKMRAAVRLSAGMFDEVAGVYLDAGRADLAGAVAGEDVVRLMRLAVALQARPELEAGAREVKARAMRTLRERAGRGDAPAAELAQLAHLSWLDGDAPGAVGYYRRALDKDYGEVVWRLGLARALADTGRVGDAIAEAEICLRLRPKWEPAEALVRELIVRPGAARE